MAWSDPAVARSAERKAYLNVVLPLFVTSVIAYLDRVNIGYAALTMNADLGFDAHVFGMGAGIFFAGYFLFEIPGALVAERYSPRLWLARIMISWGVVSGLLAFMHTASQFYLLRFLLGAAEASLYPVIYASCIPRFFAARDRARAIAVLLTSLQVSGIIGAPLAGWLVGVPLFGLEGWQVLFLIEALPAVVFGLDPAVLDGRLAPGGPLAHRAREAAPHPPVRSRGRGPGRGPARHAARGARATARC